MKLGRALWHHIIGEVRCSRAPAARASTAADQLANSWRGTAPSWRQRERQPLSCFARRLWREQISVFRQQFLGTTAGARKQCHIGRSRRLRRGSGWLRLNIAGRRALGMDDAGPPASLEWRRSFRAGGCSTSNAFSASGSGNRFYLVPTINMVYRWGRLAKAKGSGSSRSHRLVALLKLGELHLLGGAARGRAYRRWGAAFSIQEPGVIAHSWRFLLSGGLVNIFSRRIYRI